MAPSLVDDRERVPDAVQKNETLVNKPDKEEMHYHGGDHELGNSIEVFDQKAERKVLRKFDFAAVIPLGVLYMMAILDRSNLGNAQIAGMPEDIGLVGNQFGTAITLLFATYVPFEAPASMITKSVGPKVLISICTFGWGSVTLGMAFIQNYKGLYACRLLMGMFEAALIPASEIYLALVYNKSERGKRMCLFYLFSCLASAFGGLLAYGLTQIHGPNGFQGWRWLFSIEAAITLLCVPFFFFIFPKSPTDAWFLKPEEKQLMRARYDRDPHWAYDEKFSWAEAVKILSDPKFYAFFIYQFSLNLTQFGFTTFLPAIVKSLGYTSIMANLMTVPIYMTALCFFVVIAYFSDHYQRRGPFMAGPMFILVIGLTLLVGVTNNKVRFFACFLTAMGIYPSASLSIMWLQDNVSGYTKRSTMVGVVLTFANTGGVVVGQIFTSDQAPHYRRALSICLGFAALAFCIVIGLITGMSIVNRKRARLIREAQAAGTPLPPRVDHGDYDVHFKYTL